MSEHTDTDRRYTYLKQCEADVLAFSFDVQQHSLTAQQVTQLEQMTAEARALVYGSKTLNDIRENLVDLRHSEQHEIVNWYKQHRNFIKVFYRRYLPITDIEATNTSRHETQAALLEENEQHYREAIAQVNAMAASDKVSGIELSTMLNVNREIHHALKNLLQSIVL